jgi:hypothetical protein
MSLLKAGPSPPRASAITASSSSMGAVRGDMGWLVGSAIGFL